jgi:hypothetical protein
VGPKTPPFPLVPLDVDIGNTAPDTQHRDIRLGPHEGFPRCLPRHSRGGGPVPDMDEGSKGLTPEGQRKASLVKHRDDPLLHGPVGTLSNTILLRPSPDRVLPLDPMLCTKVVKLLTHVLTTLVLPESLDGASSLVLSPGLELLEVREGLRLLLHGVDCPEPARVINVGDPVPVAREGGNFDGAMDIRVDELKKLGGVMRGGGEGVSNHLASQTGFTDGIRLGRGGDLETSDQVVSDHLLENRVAGVAEALVPEGEIHGKSGGRREVGCL